MLTESPSVTEVSIEGTSLPIIISTHDTSNKQQVKEMDPQDLNVLTQKMGKFVELVSDNQKLLLDNQLSMLKKLSHLSNQFTQFTRQPFVIENVQRNENEFEQITNINMLQNFEDMLKNPDVKQEIRNKLNVVCSKGIGKGYNNCFMLVDTMFSRKFMTECSWLGGSRMESPKVCFKSFVNTLSLFFEIIHDSDETFTKMECEIFLKRVIKNSKKRFISKGLRTSTRKRRRRQLELNQDICDAPSHPIHVQALIESLNNPEFNLVEEG